MKNTTDIIWSRQVCYQVNYNLNNELSVMYQLNNEKRHCIFINQHSSVCCCSYCQLRPLGLTEVGFIMGKCQKTSDSNNKKRLFCGRESIISVSILQNFTPLRCSNHHHNNPVMVHREITCVSISTIKGWNESFLKYTFLNDLSLYFVSLCSAIQNLLAENCTFPLRRMAHFPPR